ncbi:hypothetical protein PGT21_012076 [Puccinia graminis f. sp. tritici]|uniref:Uncharacterized protein n=1 Tax=Puccinia graminis f. sp. tritici TaxID=56615 RepID=A0A5B0PVQ1_PUCGR|nr:hypothetical protein PGT21_012076 [Puccinia graminis f. sp. tritici]KAA1128185.1 hypothetical protein PGTUg99_000754 [Puccinia graminis f. sp. tritici]
MRMYGFIEDLFCLLHMHQLGPPMELRKALVHTKGEEEKKQDKEEMIIFHKEVETQMAEVNKEYVEDIAYLLANSEPSSSSRV